MKIRLTLRLWSILGRSASVHDPDEGIQRSRCVPTCRACLSRTTACSAQRCRRMQLLDMS